jgi:PPK2 family polyphosphate:nucleotide phosphotransferase
MDVAGKDGAIKHVMNGLNPQGTQVYNFKQPSVEELKHGYLWRISKSLPERGKIGVFNRSHFEEVLVVRVHNLIYKQNIPGELINKNIWQDRFSQIRAFENYLFKNGYVILKFYLHISKEEQKKRFLKRLEEPEKNWKFSIADYKEREYWQDYQKCYEEAISATSTKYSPWYIIPSDAKWYSRYLISKIIVDTMVNLKLEYPRISKNDLNIFKEYKDKLLKEK